MIKTTHMGSLPRPAELRQMLMDQQRGTPVDSSLFEERVKQAVLAAVQMQVNLGIDIISDGEQGRPNFMSYLVLERLTGFEGPDSPWISRDLDAQEAQRQFAGTVFRIPSCSGPIRYRGTEAILREIANLKEAISVTGHRGEAFLSAPAPGVIAMNFENRYYKSESEYLHAIAAALREEILAITQAGLLVQLDCPYLPLARNVAKPNQWTADGQPLYRTEEEYLRFVELSIEAQNYALQGIPREQIRCHICNGNQLSPHHFDAHLKDMLPFLPRMHCGFICVEGANPQHQLDYQALKEAKLPEGLTLIIGTIDTKTSTVETKELIAERLVRVASVVNPQKLIAGTDCGFATFEGSGYTHLAPAAVPLKMKSLVEGAHLASHAIEQQGVKV